MDCGISYLMKWVIFIVIYCMLYIFICFCIEKVIERMGDGEMTENDKIIYEAGKMAGRRDMEDELIKRGLGRRDNDEFVWTVKIYNECIRRE